MKTIMVGVPHMGNVCWDLAQCLGTWAYMENVAVVPAAYIKPTANARNFLVNHFLHKTSMEYLFMIDADQSAPADVLKIADYGLDVVAPVSYIWKGGNLLALVLQRKGDEYELKGDIVAGSIVRVDALGTGAIMIHRKVLEAIGPPWFEYPFGQDGVCRTGNDFYFSEKVAKLNYKMYVDTGIITRHYTTVELSTLAQTFAKIRK